MSKKIQDGLTIDKSFLILDEKKSGHQILEKILQIAAILIGSWSFVSILIECLNIPVNLMWIYTAIFICTGVIYLLCVFPAYDLVKLFFVVLFYGLFIFSRIPRLANGFYIIENLVIDRLVACYNFNGNYFVADYVTDIEDTTLLMIMVIIPLIILLTITIVRNRLAGYSSLLLFLPVLASFVLGKIPSEKYLIAYIIIAIYLSRSSFSFQHLGKGEQFNLLHRINSRAALWMSVFCLTLFFLLKLIIPKEQYEGISEIKDMKTEVQSAFLNLSIEDISSKLAEFKLFEYGGATGGLRGGELGKDGQIVYTGSEQLKLTLPSISLNDGVYLKGYVGTEYTGDSWEGHTAADRTLYNNMMNQLTSEKFQPVNQMNQLLSVMADKQTKKISEPDTGLFTTWNYALYKGTMDLEYRNANRKFIYAPYYTDYSLVDQIYYEQDLYAAPSKKNSNYYFNYYFMVNLKDPKPLFENLKGNTEDYARYEQAYRNYVDQVYTKLPQKGLDRLKKDFSPKKAEISSVADKIDYVQQYLATNTKYTLSPGRLPKGKDFVEYFLYENKKGYCAHYASAATLMLRAMGVPARYVEGYSISEGGRGYAVFYGEGSDDISKENISVYSSKGKQNFMMQTSQVVVTDRNAHAWVEVYMDGCGWIPVDFTPSSAVPYNVNSISNLSGVTAYIDKVKKEKTTANQSKSNSKPSVTKPPMNKKTDLQKQDPSARIKHGVKNMSSINTWFYTIFIMAVISIIAILLIRKLRRLSRIRVTKDRNKKALYLFTEIERILSYCNCLPNRRMKLEDCEAFIRERSPYIETKLFDNFMKIVKKARFSNEVITTLELKQIEDFRQKLYREAYEELSLRKKIYLKIILLM